MGRDAVHRVDPLPRASGYGEPIRRTVAAGTVLLLALATLRGHDLVTTRVTWNADVNRIVQARCVSCHSAGGRAPMPLTSYKEARPWARAIREEVVTRRMPKWQAVRGYGAFSNDPSLSSFEIALIAAWVDGGAPEGSPTNAASRSAAVETAPHGRVKEVTARCGETPIEAGTLRAVRPELAKGDGLGIAVRMPDGRTEILARIRDFDPAFAVTYWLRQPLTIPSGATLLTTATLEPCRVALTMAQP